MSCTCNKLYKPKFRRQVDRIYPRDSKIEKPIRTEMDKLVYYATVHPEKLDRLGVYLCVILENALYRRQNGWTKISIDAIEALLKACQRQQINLFVKSYTDMCRMMLEEDSMQTRKWGTSAFVAYCDVDEEGNHDRNFDAFIDIFCKFCHEEGKPKESIKIIRLCGIEGLQGIINKMSKSQMGEKLIAKHSKKIIPSLLFNMMQNENIDGSKTGPGSIRYQAEEVIRELLSIVVLSQIGIIVTPLLKHCDSHHLWETENSIVWAELFIRSVRLSYSHYIVKMIMEHTEEFKSEKSVLIKRGILNCVSQISKIPKPNTMGTIAGELISSIIRGLDEHADHRELVEQYISTCGNIISGLERVVQLELVRAMILSLASTKRREPLLSAILHALSFCDLRRTNEYSIQSDIVYPILQVSAPLLAKSSSAERLALTNILIICLDFNQNARILNRPASYMNMELQMNKSGSLHLRQETNNISVWLLENLSMPKNTTQNYLLYYQLMGILLAELCSDVVVLLFRLLLAFQDKITGDDMLKSQAHACIGATFGLLASYFEEIKPAVVPVLTERRNSRPQLAPEALWSGSSDALRRSTANVFVMDNSDQYLFKRQDICSRLSSARFDVSSLSDPLGNLDQLAGTTSNREIDTESIQIRITDDPMTMTDQNDNNLCTKKLFAVLKAAPKTRDEHRALAVKKHAELTKLDYDQIVARLEATRKRDSELMQRIMEHSQNVSDRGVLKDYEADEPTEFFIY